MTTAQNHQCCIEGARGGAELGRALNAASRDSIAVEWLADGELHSHEFSDGSRLTWSAGEGLDTVAAS